MNANLKPYDDNPVGRRQPLLLIHGIQPTDDAWGNWGRFIEKAMTVPSFRDRYKIYVFHYDDRVSYEQAGKALQPLLLKLIRQNGVTSMDVMTNSLGGLVMRYAIKNPEIEVRIRKVVSVASIHQGTPYIYPLWVTRLFRRQPDLPAFAASLFEKTSPLWYGITGKLYPYFRHVYCWENWDMPASADIPHSLDDADYCNYPGPTDASRKKFVTYASFFGLEDEYLHFLRSYLDVTCPLPRETFRPILLQPKHLLLTTARKTLLNQRLLKYCATAPIPPMLLYNDGVSSIASQLWLGRFKPDTPIAQRHEESWRLLKALRYEPKVRGRLFHGVDHRNWMEGINRTTSERIPDLLHPKERPRSLFEWYLTDLLLEP